MNDHVPTHILREQEEFTKDQERHNVWLRRKLRELDKERQENEGSISVSMGKPNE